MTWSAPAATSLQAPAPSQGAFQPHYSPYHPSSPLVRSMSGLAGSQVLSLPFDSILPQMVLPSRWRRMVLPCGRHHLSRCRAAMLPIRWRETSLQNWLRMGYAFSIYFTCCLTIKSSLLGNTGCPQFVVLATSLQQLVLLPLHKSSLIVFSVHVLFPSSLNDFCTLCSMSSVISLFIPFHPHRCRIPPRLVSSPSFILVMLYVAVMAIESLVKSLNHLVHARAFLIVALSRRLVSHKDFFGDPSSWLVRFYPNVGVLTISVKRRLFELSIHRYAGNGMSLCY
jgi:hypothetical protein